MLDIGQSRCGVGVLGKGQSIDGVWSIVWSIDGQNKH
jgi:hypothetical protein